MQSLLPESILPAVPTLLGFVALHAFIWCICHMLQIKTSYLKPTEQGRAPHHAAHLVVSYFAFLWLAVLGLYSWFYSPDPRLPGVSLNGHPARSIAQLMIAFQTYEVSCAISLPKLRGKYREHLAHHVITFSLAFMATANEVRYLYYYAPFYMGIAELSSMPLAFMDTFKQFPQLNARFPVLAELVQVSFAASFLVLRNVLWPFVNYPFWKDSLGVLSGSSALTAPVYVNLSFLISNVLLTLLQYYWGSLIVGGVMKKLKGESVADSKEFKES